jgi:long-chain acyl-CoA synthetase
MTAIAPEQLPLQRLYRWEKERADKVYLTQPLHGGGTIDFTWRQAMDEVRRMAAHLKSLNFPKGSNIALMSKNCAHWLLADYAIWMAGHVSVPLYPTLAATTVQQILEHSESRLLFVGKLDDWSSMRAGVHAALPCIALPLAPQTGFQKWSDIVAKTDPMRESPVRGADELATIIYTSGTTGVPKGVMHSFGTMAAAAADGQVRFSGQTEDRVFSYLPLSHVAERIGIELISIAVGNHIFFAESLDTFAKDLRRARPTRFVSVPRLWVKFQQGVLAKMPPSKLNLLLKIPVVKRIVGRKILEGLGLDQCTLALGGAAPMPPALLNWYQSLGLEIVEASGMTENFGLSHSNLQRRTRPGYVGQPYPQTRQRIDPATGEVQLRSPNTMLGYYKDPEKTKEAFTADGWLRTGDKGQIDKDGSLKITGRVKDLFKTSKGKYVAPAPIEDKLVMHPKVEACCVAGANQGQPCGLVMLSADGLKEASDDARRQVLAQSLAEHLQRVNAMLDPHEQMDFLAIVKDSWTVENGFITPSLKVKRNVIENAYGGFLETWYAKREPVVWQ